MIPLLHSPLLSFSRVLASQWWWGANRGAITQWMHEPREVSLKLSQKATQPEACNEKGTDAALFAYPRATFWTLAWCKVHPQQESEAKSGSLACWDSHSSSNTSHAPNTSSPQAHHFYLRPHPTCHRSGEKSKESCWQGDRRSSLTLQVLAA